MAYVIERASRSGTRYVGIYRAANGKYKSAGTYDSHERAYEVAEEEERHARGFLEETSPAGKATMTISEFCEQRFLRYHAVSPGTRQEYGYLAKNHIVPYVGHLRISEVNRETRRETQRAYLRLSRPTMPATRGSAGPLTREWTCRRCVSAQDTAASRSRLDTPRSSTSATPASQIPLKRSSTVRVLP